MEELKRAIDYLAGRCNWATTWDGEGFNKFDADFGHSLANYQTWSPKQARAAWKMVRKYKEQLTQAGIDYDKIPEPPEVAETEKNDIISAMMKGSQIVIQMPYKCTNFFPALNAIKSIPGRRWNDKAKNPPNVWIIPIEQAFKVIDKLEGFANFKPSNALVKLAKKQSEAAGIFRTAATAKSSDLTVKGLGGELFPFQKAGVEYAVKTKRVIIADEMGLGKTIEALATVEHLKAFPAVVVCPATVKINWAREAKKWLPDRSVEIWSGRNSSDNPADIIVLNYDILDARLEDLLALNPQAVILDESHYVKNHKANRTRAALKLGKKVNIKLCLTGTPVLNRPNELISPLNFLGHLESFGGFWHFVNHYCGAHRGYFGWDFSGATNLDELHEKLKATCFVRRRKEDVLPELPEKVRAIIPIEIDNQDEYNKAERDLIAWVGQKAIEDVDFLGEIENFSEEEQKLAKRERTQEAQQRARNAEHLVKIEALKQLAVKGKLKSVIDWIRDFVEVDGRLVIFAHHREVVETLYKEFSDSAVMIIGGESTEKRQEAIDKFQNDESCRLAICSIKAGGTGITLTAASNVAFIELGWSPADHDQAEDRLHRIGQKNSVTCYYLLAANTIEEKIAALIDKKRGVVDATTDGIETEVEQGILAALMKALQEEE